MSDTIKTEPSIPQDIIANPSRKRQKRNKAPTTAPDDPGPNNSLKVPKGKDEAVLVATAKALLKPDFRHGMATSAIHRNAIGKTEFAPGIGDYANALKEIQDDAAKGDLAFVSRMLAAQAVTLDNVFAEMARRMATNMGEYLPATEVYARIALKAQANSRATLEALAKLHQPREQTVRHIHVNEGGQALITDQYHHHTGGAENAKLLEQPHAAGSAGPSAALPSPDPLGNGVSVPSRQGVRAVSDARGQR